MSKTMDPGTITWYRWHCYTDTIKRIATQWLEKISDIFACFVSTACRHNSVESEK
jgi:hypothetical protein